MESGFGKLAKLHFRVIQDWSFGRLFDFKLHTWKLGADVWIDGFLLEQSLELTIVLRNLVRP